MDNRRLKLFKAFKRLIDSKLYALNKPCKDYRPYTAFTYIMFRIGRINKIGRFSLTITIFKYTFMKFDI